MTDTVLDYIKNKCTHIEGDAYTFNFDKLLFNPPVADELFNQMVPKCFPEDEFQIIGPDPIILVHIQYHFYQKLNRIIPVYNQTSDLPIVYVDAMISDESPIMPYRVCILNIRSDEKEVDNVVKSMYDIIDVVEKED